ncbi:glycosyltransferase family 2 protein [Anaeromyxobacter sp. PSR-1]|uniref:glycosyltransferase family 2 protein n=1 Tax=Anaeromyxobacter sp. PSR-1 TaxID=1300915 RepID=UPI0005E4D989|nr:glycosyltransferase family 2 protein [Anaeromyxobacter sp. PSR-1]GAO03017.1 lipopolysaccharide core biosynthesis glycosyltransferase WaaE [Anaeromyxobacter sp. PSR-1]
MRLGGFVIHGNSADTLDRCLAGIAAVADECVAVDSCSTDGSADLARARGFRRVELAWRGYGAARAAAVEALEGCSHVFFLDSDEWLEPEAIAAIRAWKATGGGEAPYHGVLRRDWADLDGHRFLFRTEHHVRLIRREAARWDPGMIVHESLPPAPTVHLPIHVEHRFATSVEAMRSKVDRYALLWAIRYRAEGARRKAPAVQKAVHLVRHALFKGAVARGGADGWRLAEAVGHYHGRKYALLRELDRGAYPELVRAYAEGRLEELYRMLPG